VAVLSDAPLLLSLPAYRQRHSLSTVHTQTVRLCSQQNDGLLPTVSSCTPKEGTALS